MGTKRASDTARRPFPPGTILAADDGLRLRQDGRILLGGNPLRFIRLTETGARTVRAWLAGAPPASTASTVALARRLVDAGMIHPSPPPGIEPAPLTVIIPVKDDEQGLRATLNLLKTEAVIVVDDGSRTPLRPLVSSVAPSAVTIRRECTGGPGVARQEGLKLIETPLVAFVDAGVQIEVSDLARLAGWFADPEVVAVGPRVAAAVGDDLISDYEQLHSPLDLGPAPSPVGPGRLVSYLPSACLLVRSDVVDALGGFDPDLRFGEDVDLVWRLAKRGSVRYDPSIVVTHPARATVCQLARQRFGYGSAAAPLADRHGYELAPVRMSGWSAAVIVLALLGRPLAAISLGAATAALLARKLKPLVPDHRSEAGLLTARGHLWAGLSAAAAGNRVWWPLPVLAALLGWRRPLRLVWGLSLLRRLGNTGGSPARRVRHSAIGVVDDLAYGSGVWAGAIRRRSLRALLPRFVSWPSD